MEIAASTRVDMRVGNTDAPYLMRRGDFRLRFSLVYASAEDVLPLVSAGCASVPRLHWFVLKVGWQQAGVSFHRLAGCGCGGGVGGVCSRIAGVCNKSSLIQHQVEELLLLAHRGGETKASRAEAAAQLADIVQVRSGRSARLAAAGSAACRCYVDGVQSSMAGCREALHDPAAPHDASVCLNHPAVHLHCLPATPAAPQEFEEAERFNAGWLEEEESVVAEAPASAVSPLAAQPGRAVLTQQRLYFQPFSAGVAAAPLQAFQLSKVVAVSPRVYQLEDLGLEVFFSSRHSLYLAFRAPPDRARFHRLLMAQPALQLDRMRSREQWTRDWVGGRIRWGGQRPAGHGGGG